MTAYTSARFSVSYDWTIASGVAPALNARRTSSRSTRLLPTRKTPAGSSRSGTTMVEGSKSSVVMGLIPSLGNHRGPGTYTLYHSPLLLADRRPTFSKGSSPFILPAGNGAYDKKWLCARCD